MRPMPPILLAASLCVSLPLTGCATDPDAGVELAGKRSAVDARRGSITATG